MEPERLEHCPECELGIEALEPVDRRDFIRVVGGSAALLAAGTVPAAGATSVPEAPRRPRPAEALIRELYLSLSAEQRQAVVYPWNHGAGRQSLPTRQRMFNRPIGQPIGRAYNRTQQELIDRILRAISSGEDGYQKLTRNGTFDGSRSLQGCGAYIFGDPTAENGRFAWVFMGHHLTVRCDGNTVPGAAFGGPIYYGHSPNGYSNRNIFYYQTQAVRRVFDSLSAQQLRQAVLDGSPGEHERSVRFRPENQIPGLPASELTRDQRQLVEQVMQTILSPYRREDADEVMQIVRQNGGLERLHMAFYRHQNDNARWRFWRIEGPGFVWNFRVLPHVHTYVNISSRYQSS